MEAATSRPIGAAAVLAVISHGTGNRGRNDLATILCLHRCVSAGAKSPIHDSFGIPYDVIVSHRGTDAGAAGDAKAAGQIDIQGIILRRYGCIFTRRDGGTSDARLRGIIDAVHAHRGVKGHGLRHAAGCREGDIGSLGLRVHDHILPAGHNGAAIDVSHSGILLTHRQSRATQTALRRFGHIQPAILIEKLA